MNIVGEGGQEEMQKENARLRQMIEAALMVLTEPPKGGKRRSWGVMRHRVIAELTKETELTALLSRWTK